jgi:hypothetical protein
MNDPVPLLFAERWAETDLTGAPLIESVLRGFVGRCQSCGRGPEERTEPVVLINPLELDGTLYGDTYCFDCCEDETDGPHFVLPPFPETHDETEGSH